MPVSNASTDTDGQRISFYAAYVIGLLLLVNIMNYGQRMLPAILLPSIKADLHLTDTELGVLMGAAFGICYALAALPLARLAERVGRQNWLAGSLAVWSLITATIGFAQTFAHLMAARIGTGLAEAPAIPCSHAIIADQVPEERRALAFSIHSLGAVIGISLVLAIGGYLGSVFGWRRAFVLVALPGIFLSLLMLVTLRGGRQQARPVDTPAAGLFESVWTLLGERFYCLVLVAVCMSVIVEFGMNQWLPTFYVRQFGLPLEEVGYRYGMAVAMGGLPGTLAGGLLSDRLMRRDRRWVVWMPASMYVLALPTGLCMLLAPDAETAFLLNGVYGFLIHSTSGSLWAACMLLARTDLRATASAVALALSGLTGLTLGPIVVGLLSDTLATTQGTDSLRTALVTLELNAVIVVITLFLAGRILSRHGDGSVGNPPSVREDLS